MLNAERADIGVSVHVLHGGGESGFGLDGIVVEHQDIPASSACDALIVRDAEPHVP
jgi:hypothetical protein